MENKAKKPFIYNVTCTLANTEYSQALPIRASKIQVQSRNNNDIKLCFISGQSGTTYFTVKGGMTYFDAEIMNAEGAIVLYFQSPTAGEVCEILAWVED